MVLGSPILVKTGVGLLRTPILVLMREGEFLIIAHDEGIFPRGLQKSVPNTVGIDTLR